MGTNASGKKNLLSPPFMYSCLQLRNCVGSCFRLHCENSVFSQTEAVTELKAISENYSYDSIKQTPEEMIVLEPFFPPFSAICFAYDYCNF